MILDDLMGNSLPWQAMGRWHLELLPELDCYNVHDDRGVLVAVIRMYGQHGVSALDLATLFTLVPEIVDEYSDEPDPGEAAWFWENDAEALRGSSTELTQAVADLDMSALMRFIHWPLVRRLFRKTISQWQTVCDHNAATRTCLEEVTASMQGISVSPAHKV